MYGFNTSLTAHEAFRFCALPGAYVFMQRYQPVPGGPSADLSRLFDERADGLLDELVRIVFTQNMKSMETYYRWLALQITPRSADASTIAWWKPSSVTMAAREWAGSSTA